MHFLGVAVYLSLFEVVLFWWAGVGKFQEGCIGGQVDRRAERKVASWLRVSAPAASAQSNTVFGPHSRPQALRVSGTATLPGRLLVTTIEPTRRTPNSPAKEG